MKYFLVIAVFLLLTLASASALLKRRAVMGIIQAIDGDTLTLSHQIKTESKYTVFLTPDTIIKSKSATSSASLTVGLRIAVVGVPGAGGITARLIHIIPGRAVGVFSRPTSTIPTPTLVSTPSATLSPTSAPPPPPAPAPPPSP